MRIVQITPGAGGSFYCENCLRDNAAVAALRAAGHEVWLVPMYLPLVTEEDAAEMEAVFFGGINVYLQQKFSLFRHTPRWVDRVFDAPSLLHWAAGKAGMTTPQTLGETTLSMLRGEEGRQGKEIDRLVDFLAALDPKPEVVCLSNALLIGLARAIRRRVGVPVVCGLQDEDGFLDGLVEPYRTRAWRELRERAADVDLFFAVSRWYAERMAPRLGTGEGPGRTPCRVVPCGVDATGYEPAAAPPDPPAVGFLAQICPAKGLDALVEAFVELKSQPRFASLKLRAAGGWTSADEDYVGRIRRRLGEAGFAEDAELLPALGRSERIEFLRGLSVLSVPTPAPEAFGLFVLEAWAAGVPVVQPAHGGFVELVERFGGGLLCAPEAAGGRADGATARPALAGALAELLDDPSRARELGRRAREAVLGELSVERTAALLAGACREAIELAAGRENEHD